MNCLVENHAVNYFNVHLKFLAACICVFDRSHFSVHDNQLKFYVLVLRHYKEFKILKFDCWTTETRYPRLFFYDI